MTERPEELGAADVTSGSGLRAAFYGDDFTGSVDALLQFARRGWRGRLFVGVPDRTVLAEAATEVDVVGIAGIARSLGSDAWEAEVRPALEALTSLRPPVIQFKACSTADSSPDIGSLGRVIELGREIVAPAVIPLLFAQPDFGRYTVFGHHFAAENGHVYRLDRQPTMSRHPSTPMTESELAVHLGRQTKLPIGAIPFTEYTSPADLADRLLAHGADGEVGVVLDALDDHHVSLIGGALALLRPPVFAIGSGGLSLGLATADGGFAAPLPTTTTTPGPVLVVSGSRSAQTRRQAMAAASAGWHVQQLPLPADSDAIASVVGHLRAGTSVVLTSDDAVVAASDPLPAIARAAAEFVRAAITDAGVRRVVVCGGDTSSRIAGLLGARSLEIAANPWGNIVLLRAIAPGLEVDGVELLLKGGQVGADDLFERIRTLGT
ncbi:four-carbon acid sugar kinase family protein [Microbacterium panaciterrae]|uniref:Four-carbon acid sugar kinase family protein n=1 Tax=Microbacterium panaciterrae TaxID=985759 RepID=A0ABP8PLY8_9MICO